MCKKIKCIFYLIQLHRTMSGIVIISGSRTPIGDFNKSLSTLSTAELGATAISSALEKARVSPAEVNLCIMGQVLFAGEGRGIAILVLLMSKIMWDYFERSH